MLFTRIIPSVCYNERHQHHAQEGTANAEYQTNPPLDHLFASIFTSLSSKLAYSNTSFNVTNASITDAERKSVRKLGRVCVVDLTFTVGTDITGNTVELFNGLPPAANETRFRLPHGYDATKPPLTLAITTGGKIINQWSTGGVRTGQWAGQAVYISAE